MATKVKASSKPPTKPKPAALGTTDERLQRIEALGRKIAGYVQFMCDVGNLNRTSPEAKERAVLAFYEQIVILERQLGRVYDDFKLE